MNGFIKKILLFIILVLPTLGNAQNVSVASFKQLENDLTANTTGTMERDQNGEVAALIKVVTTEQGFVFDGGMTGIVKTKQEVGEVWVYVPQGIKRITIQHNQLGVLRDYYFPIAIEKARTYEMVLTTGKVETIVKRTAGKQYVTFKVAPLNAVVELDDMLLDVDGNGYVEKSVHYGTHSYRVSCTNYHTEAGQIVVSEKEKAEVNVTLRPNFGWIDFKGADEYHGAQVYVDNERIGQLPLRSGTIKSGVHQVKIMKPLYKPYETKVTVTDNEITELAVELIPNFAHMTLKADKDCEIWVDEKFKGKEVCEIDLELGKYTVEVKRASHRTVSDVVLVSDVLPRTVQLPLPTPIYGVLDVTSTPSNATVIVDGVEVGQTPLIKGEILLGKHNVVFKKEGYAAVEKIAELTEEGEESKLSAELPKSEKIHITSEPEGASVAIDGVYQGITPLTYELTWGRYEVSFYKDGYLDEKRSLKVDDQTSSLHQNMKSSSEEVKITSSPSEAIITIDGEVEGVTPLKTTLARGSHLISVEKDGYKGYSSYRSIPAEKDDDFHFKLEKVKELKEKKTFSKHYKNFAWYLDGGVDYSSDFEIGGAFRTGLYLLGLNVELGYQVYDYTDVLALRAGLGIRCGRKVLITPQVGINLTDIGLVEDFSNWYTFYNHLEDTDWSTGENINIASCRFLYCFSRCFAFNITPEYNFVDGSISVRAGLVFNLGL
ncbi:MAG: PEGA domain-containing protein [Bacteroidaceae bacterium]|nr:PEGA domain-containing protein [Bacteroidaceae bacterium]